MQLHNGWPLAISADPKRSDTLRTIGLKKLRRLTRCWHAIGRKVAFLRSGIADYGAGNRAKLAPTRAQGFKLEFFGADNLIQIAGCVALQNAQITCLGSGNDLRIDAGASVNDCRFWLHSDRGRIHIGANVSIQGAEIIVTDDDGCITVGADTMVGPGCEIRCGDGHAIYDRDTYEIMNRATHLFIGEGVLVGSRVQILKNVCLGNGSIVGADSVVTADVLPHSLAVGVPARTVRRNIGWTRERIDALPSDWPSRRTE